MKEKTVSFDTAFLFGDNTAFFSLNGSDGSRTHDLCVANAALSQLSYEPEFDLFYHMLMWLRNQEGKGSVFSGKVLSGLTFSAIIHNWLPKTTGAKA